MSEERLAELRQIAGDAARMVNERPRQSTRWASSFESARELIQWLEDWRVYRNNVAWAVKQLAKFDIDGLDRRFMVKGSSRPGTRTRHVVITRGGRRG
jgi:hypothetical protein